MPGADGLPILLVDDDVALTRTLEDILALEGFAARSAGEGRTALGLARELRPVVAIVDLRLPDMNGLDLASELRKEAPEVQVVILTGNASVESALRAVRDHNSDYLVKPVQPEELIRTVRSAEARWQLGRAEHELKRSRSTLSAVFDASPLPMVVLDPSLKVRMWNPSAERVFGWSTEEALGERVPLELPGEDLLPPQALGAALQGRSGTGFELRRRRRDGAILHMRLSVAGLPEPSGDIGAVLTVYEDITDQRRIEERLQQAERLDALGRLAGGVAHDFNNLLGVVMTEAELALRVRGVDPGVESTLRSILDTAGRGATLTRQLLAFARRQPMQEAIVDPNAVVRDVERMLHRLVGPRVELVTELDGSVGHVKVDRGQLEQVITNLAVNARDAMPGGGRLRIATRSETITAERRRLGLEPGEWVVLVVEDSGVGIPEEHRSRIFEPFFTTKDKGSGTGLGLATSYGIVQKFGGRLVVESQVGTGTTFSVCLPRVASPAEPGRLLPERDIPGGTEAVLLVEDNASLRALTTRILAGQGHTVHAVGSGAEARRALDELPEAPTLLIVDAHLPDGDGRDLIRELTAERPELKVLLVSGSFEASDRDDVSVPFLEKPYTLTALTRTVREVLDGTYSGPGSDAPPGS